MKTHSLAGSFNAKLQRINRGRGRWVCTPCIQDLPVLMKIIIIIIIIISHDEDYHHRHRAKSSMMIIIISLKRVTPAFLNDDNVCFLSPLLAAHKLHHLQDKINVCVCVSAIFDRW